MSEDARSDEMASWRNTGVTSVVIALVLCGLTAPAVAQTQLDPQLEKIEQFEKELQAMKEEAASGKARIEQLEKETAELKEALAGETGGKPGVLTDEHQATIKAKPTAGYAENAGLAGVGGDAGFFVQSEDGRFRLNVSGYSQIRYDVNVRETPPDGDDQTTYGFSMPRTLLFFEGQLTESFDFHIRPIWDIDGNVSLLNAWGQWNINDHWNIRAGEIFVKWFREDWMLGKDVLGAEYSVNDFVFGIGPSLGIQANYMSDTLGVWVAFSNGGSGSQDEPTFSTETDGTLSARVEYQAVGTDWRNWDDVIGRRGRPTGVLLGFGAAVESSKNSTTRPESARDMTVDVSTAGDGWNTLVAATWRNQKPQDGSNSYSNYGLLVQGGYFVSRTSQLFLRYDFISPGDQPGDLENFNELAVGYNFLPLQDRNMWKFTLETAYEFNPLSNTIVPPDPILGLQPADEGGQFLLRSQLQFGF